MARPEKYKANFAKIAEKACALGATDLDLADMLDVSLRTVRYWRATKPEFAKALAIGKTTADQHVERSLYQRAMGYSCNEDDVRVVDGKVVKTELLKEYPPDTTAMIFWLKNRKPKDWRDKRETEISGNLNLTDMTDDELDRAIAAKEAALKGSEA